MQKTYVIAAVAIMIVLGLAVTQLSQTGKVTGDRKEVKVGAILSLTGDFSVFGTELQKGIELARDELNGKGGGYRIIFEDDGNVEIKKAVEASHKLIEVDSIDAAFVTAVNEGKAVSRIFEEKQKPLIVLYDTTEELANGDYTFTIGFSTEEAGKVMARFAYGKLDARSISVVYSIDEWSYLIAASFKSEFEILGGTVIIFEGTDPSEKDFRTVIEKSKDADALYAPLLLPANFVKQSRELGYNGHILSGDGLNQEQIDAAGSAAEDAYLTTVYAPESEKIKKLSESYKAKYNEEPKIIELAAVGYDAMYAIDAAVRDSGSENIKDGLYKVRLEGATGMVDFDERGLSPRFERIYLVKDGRIVLVE